MGDVALTCAKHKLVYCGLFEQEDLLTPKELDPGLTSSLL